MRLAVDTERLARLADAGYMTDHHTRRPRRVLLDTEGSGVRVEVPAPGRLAEYVTIIDAEAFQSGRTIMARPVGSDAAPEPVDAHALADALLRALRDMPDRPGMDGRPYADLRLFAAHSSAAPGYALDVIRAVRRTLPKPLRDEPPAERRRRQPTTSAERHRRARARRRIDEDGSIAWALREYLDDDEDGPEPGTTVPATDVRDYVRDRLAYAVEEWDARVERPDPYSGEYFMDRAERVAEWLDYAEDEFLPPVRPRIPSARRIYEVAEAAGFRRTRSHGLDRLTAPRKDTDMQLAQELLDRAAAMLLDEARADIERIINAAETPAADAVPGAVVENVIPFRRRA